ncbi:S8 family serine peptidase [Erythrobacter sp.]|uniref:S8 family serine peptidase n=1 Tax=Erythrobacter sp. TaxID=1042 RepID=UPI001425BF59|nr:S8 family serine peptidase [Erythrobacter sp.]QIQ85465.1 MAG: S8 family serine peptidase [Erythrobacter sp.]
MRRTIAIASLVAAAMTVTPVPGLLQSPLAAQDAGDDDDDDDDDGGFEDEDDLDDPDDDYGDDDYGEDDHGDDDYGDGGDEDGGEEGDEAGGDDFEDDGFGDDDFEDDEPGDDDFGEDEPGDGDPADDDAAEDDFEDDETGDDDLDDEVGDDDFEDDGAEDDGAEDDAGEDGSADDDLDDAMSQDDDDDAEESDGGDDDDGGDDREDDEGESDEGDDDEREDDYRDEDDDDGDDDGDDYEADEYEGGDDYTPPSDQWEYASIETAAERSELDERDRIDTDREGFRYRRAEFVALDLTREDLDLLRAGGFDILESEELDSLDGTLHLLRGPPVGSDEDSLDAVEAVADPDVFGFNHLFDGSSVRTRRKRDGSIPRRLACGCEIGLIDTGVATKLSHFGHVSVVQRAFNGRKAKVRPGLHGTAVAHLMAGTERHPARPTTIYVADIFSGPRSTSGSSFALIKALDWLASRGVPVINVSLAGPSNPAVASAIERLTKRGHVVVAAAGNDGPAAPPVFPGAYRGVVGVTAVDGANRIYRYANRGAYIDFAARGVAVTAIDARGSVRDATGTSFAAPLVAARVAGELRRPDSARSRQVIRALEARARDLGPPGRDPIYGVGLVEGSD